MPDYSVGFFLVPADFLDELHTMEVECENLPVATSVHEAYFHSNQMFLRARDVAVVSDVVGGSYQPIADHGRSAAFLRLGYWIKNVLLNGYSRGVLDPHHLEPLVHAFDAASLEEFLAWNDRNDLFGAADHALLTELFTALDRVLHARPAEPHGLVYLNFLEKYRDPPPPEPEPPEPTISPADNRKWAQLQQFRIQAAINRQRRPWWVEAQHEEGRVLVGLLVPDRVDELADAYRRAIELFTGDEVRAGQAALNHEVIPRVEAALLDPLIETMGGRVQALRWLRAYLRWKTGKSPAALQSPDLAVELDQLLDRLLDDEAITWMHGEELYWSRTLVRDTCRGFREVLGRAVATGHGFAWLFDEYRT